MSVGDVVGVKIVRRNDCGMENLEVRAGLTRVPDSQRPSKGRLWLNTKVAKFSGPANPAQKTYKICFEKQVRAKYITLQILGWASLDINEVSPILPGDGMCNKAGMLYSYHKQGLCSK